MAKAKAFFLVPFKERGDPVGSSLLPEYPIWVAMLSRCYSPNDRRYADWGGRGIRVCESWQKSFLAFLTDMGRRPEGGYQLDRIDNDDDYCPENCRWTDVKTNNLNRRDTVRLTHAGVTRTAQEWSERLGINIWTIYSRIKYGWPVEDVLFWKPVFGAKRPKRRV